MTRFQHATRMGLLMAVAAVLLGWVLQHKETNFADGLRYIHRAEKIQAANWRDGLVKGIDHPLHPLLIAAVHRGSVALTRRPGRSLRFYFVSPVRCCWSFQSIC